MAAYATAVARDEVTGTYSNNGLQATLTDAKGNKTTYEYDGFDRLKKIRYPSPTTAGTSSTTDYEEYTYDAASNVTQDRRRDGTTVSFGYDNLNRQTSGLLGATYAYDNLGRMTSATLSSVTTTIAWDALGRQTGETGPLGTVSYQYDLAGRRTRLTWPDSFYVTYDHNVAGDLTAIRENGAASGVGVLATYAYDNLGRRVSLTRGNGVVTGYGYDAASRLTSLAQDLAGSGADTTFTFSHNAAGQVLSRTGTNSAYAPAAQGALTRSYTANGLNQYTAVAGTSLTYDGRGNLSNDGAKTYGYDAANRLTSVTGATLSYDVMGRLSQTAGTATTRFAYDGVDLIGEYSSGGSLLRRYVHGPAFDEPLVWYEGSGTTDRRWLVADQLGSVIAVTDGTGASTATNTYDAYGQAGSSNTGRFQYTGQTWLPEVGLYHYKARAYSPSLGRFMQTDPIGYGDGMNLYAYVGNDPVNWLDPMGLEECPEETNATSDTEVCGITVVAGDPCKVPGKACFSEAPRVIVKHLIITYVYIALTPALDLLMAEHYYSLMSNVCQNAGAVTAKQMAAALSRFAFPGQNPRKPARNGGTYFVFDPRNGMPGGWIQSSVSGDGLTVVNSTTPFHVFHNGDVQRHASVFGGSWLVTTTGTGTNPVGLNQINQSQGPKIMAALDQKLRDHLSQQYPACGNH